MLIRPRHASSCNSLFPRPGPAAAGQLWQLATADARCSAGQAGPGRRPAVGRATHGTVSYREFYISRHRLESGRLQCSDTETAMTVFWLLNLIWTLLGSATGIDKENIKYFDCSGSVVIFSSFVATELIESGLSEGWPGLGREGGREDCPHDVMLWLTASQSSALGWI